MKKFCSKCGNQLDLGKKCCTVCQAFNPYFIAGFTSNEVAPAVIISLKQEPKATSVIEENPASQNENAAELESLRQKQLEQQKNDLELKSQLLKVKAETEQFKNETFSLVKDVQKELHDIEKENKLLKEKVELLKSNQQAKVNEPVTAATRIPAPKAESKKSITAIAAIVLLFVVTGVSFAFFNNASKKAAQSMGNNPAQPAKPASLQNDTKLTAQKSVVTNSAPNQKLLAVASSPSSTKALPAVSVPVPSAVKTAPSAASKTEPARFLLTESKLRGDLVGKKLSGCDITIKSASEINSIDHLVLVDKLSPSYLKYKCTVKIKQGSDVYTSTPYLYYSAQGTFIRVDGTNCE